VYTQFLKAITRRPRFAPPRESSHAALPLSLRRSQPFSHVLGFQSVRTSLPPQQYFMSTTGRPVSACSRSPSASSGPKVVAPPLPTPGDIGAMAKLSAVCRPR